MKEAAFRLEGGLICIHEVVLLSLWHVPVSQAGVTELILCHDYHFSLVCISLIFLILLCDSSLCRCDRLQL